MTNEIHPEDQQRDNDDADEVDSVLSPMLKRIHDLEIRQIKVNTAQHDINTQVLKTLKSVEEAYRVLLSFVESMANPNA